jgi:hypothetical protein
MTHTPDQYYWPDKPMEHSRISRFGMTCEPLMGNRGAELLTLFREASLARIYPLQDVALGWTESVVDSGGKWRESLARYDRDSHSLKTAQLSLVEDWTGCSVTLPRSGLMLDGQCWELPMLGRITKGIESGFLPTPVAMDAGSGRFNTSKGGKPRPTLALMARKDFWPTPKASDDKKSRGNPLENAKATQARGFSLSLPEMVAMRMWPTPTAHNAKETNAPSEALRNTPTLAAQSGGHLNPNWVEQLMGWPIGHTDLKPLATDKSHNVAPPLGDC